MNINLTLIGQLIAFIAFVAFCMRFVWPPIVAAMAERQQKITDGLAAADRASHDLELAQKNATAQMAEAKKEAAGIIESANKRAAALIDEAKAAAVVEADRVKAAASAEIEQERARAQEAAYGSGERSSLFRAQRKFSRRRSTQINTQPCWRRLTAER